MRLNLGISAVLVAAVVAIYAQTADFDGVRFDDEQYVAGHVHLRDGLSAEGIRWAFSETFASNYFPLTFISHMIDRDLYGSNLGGHHLTSVALHALNASLLFGALLYMTGARGPSAAVAALFAVHPLNVESVAWIAERKNVLSTTFWILSMWSYAAYARRGGWGRYLSTAFLMALGLLAKPMLVTLPLALLLLDYWPLDRVALPGDTSPATGGARPRRSPGFLLVEKLPLLVLSAASSLMTLYAQRGVIQSGDLLSFGPRLSNAVVAYSRYLGKLVWPSDLAMFYPHPDPSIPGGTPLEVWQIGGAAVLLLAITVFAVVARRRYAITGWLWFLGTLVPTLGLVQVGVQAMADRYSYVPAIGVFLVLCWAGTEALVRIRAANPRAAKAAQGSAIAILIALGVAAFGQARYWGDSIALFEHTLEINPRNPTIRYNLANAYRSRGELDAAIGHYRTALEADPESIATRINLGNALRSNGEPAAAAKEYLRVLERRPKHPTVHNNLGTALMRVGRLDQAIAHYRYAIAVDSDFSRAHYNLANALRSRGDSSGAIDHYRLALDASPADPRIHNNLGTVLHGLGRYDEAIDAYRAAIAFDPGHERAQNNLGLLLARRGDIDAAIHHYRLAISAFPDYANAHNNLGVAHQAQGAMEAAIAAYSAAVRADPEFEAARQNLTDALSVAAGAVD